MAENERKALESGFAVVKIYTEHLAIVGKIRVLRRDAESGNLLGFINQPGIRFLPVQDATVLSTRDKKPLAKKTLILLNKAQIEWILPIKEPEFRPR